MTERDYLVFRRAAWYAIPPVRRVAAWPILLAVLPIIFDLLMAWLRSRDQRYGTIDAVEAIRSYAAEVDPRLERCLEWAEAEIP